TPDEPVAGEVEPEVTPDEPVVGEVEPEVTPDEPLVGEVEPEVTPDEPVAGEVEPEVTPDEPVAGEVEPEVTADEPVAGEVEPEVTADEPVVGEVEPEVTADEPVVGEVEPEVTPDEPVVGEVEPEVNETDTADNSNDNIAGDIVEETLGVVDEVPAGNSDAITQDVGQESDISNDSATAFEDSSSPESAQENEVEIVDNASPETTTTESEIVESETSNFEQSETALETSDEVQVEAGVIEEAAEPNKIVEELIEQAEIRETKNAEVEQEQTETAQEATQEEIVEEEVVIEETVEKVDQEIAQEETVEEEVVAEETTEEEIVQEEAVEEVDTEETAQEETAEELEEDTAQEETEEEVAQEEEEIAEEQNSEAEIGQLDRVAYETQFQEAPNDLAILMQEEFQLTQLMDSSGIELYGSIPSVDDISRRLAQLAEQTGQRPAFINISLQSNQLESFVVMPEQTIANADGSLLASSELNGVDLPNSNAVPIRKTIKDTSRKDLIATATEFREEISDIRRLNQSDYKKSAQELYDVIIRPIEAELEANDIDVLVFSMDSGLRLLPIAALHDGEQFLIEKYAMGMVPSFGLTDTRYVSPNEGSILAMGASEFENQAALPTMPIELQTIVSNPRRGESFLNEQFTIPNFVAQNSREAPFSIIHLGTHAEFKAGDLSDSYIQFYDEQLKIPQLQQLSEELGWNSDATPIELLVLSACETALGDQEAELGFAGLAVQAGVKSALASLWYVSDLGTLALMGEFYDQLGTTLVKAEALRQTQLEMLGGNVKVDNRQVKLSNGADLALPEDFPEGSLTLDHPYFWSSFTLIGNWN
ncbi:MAG: CHAT domain-containing protein, partial [Cyanobacteria bacterium J06600_6]